MMPYTRNKTLVDQEKYKIILNGGKIMRTLPSQERRKFIIALKKAKVI